MELPEHVTLCEICGCAPVHDMTIPKWVFEEVGQCFADGDCEPTEDADADAQEDGWGSLTDYDPKDINYYERGISEPT